MMPNSRLLGGILADRRCSVKLAYFHLSHVPHARYSRRLTGVDWSTGVRKAV